MMPSMPPGEPHRARAAQPRSATSRTWRLRSSSVQNAAFSPGRSKLTSGSFSQHQRDLEQRMARQRPLRIEHLDQPVERQFLVAVGRQIAEVRTRPTRSRKLGWPDVSVRSTSVLMKKPTRSSNAVSVRPAIGLPIGMSVPAPSRASGSNAARPACSTMNRLACASPASRSTTRDAVRQGCAAAPCRRDKSQP